LKTQNKQVHFVRFDEGGELARSTEINKMLIDEFDIIMHSTGGYASHLNGITERGHRTDADSIKASLYAANLDDKYWCFALLHSNFINRRWCRYPTTTTPYELWTGKKPDFRTMHIFGASIYVHNEQAKKLDHKTCKGIFLGFGASTAVVYYLDQNKQTIKRAHHAKVDNHEIGASPNSPGSLLIKHHSHLDDVVLPKEKSQLEVIDSPFSYETLYSYEVTITETGPIGLNLEDDKIFGLPVINLMHEDSPFRSGCKKSLHKNAWIVGIHNYEPITVHRFLEYLDHLRKQKVITFQITLTKRVNTTELITRHIGHISTISGLSQHVLQ